MYKLVLVRHGQSTWNLENRFTGWTDVGLTDLGWEEAHEAGKLLRDGGYIFDVAYTSVLRRAIQTLWTVLQEMSLEWIPVTNAWQLNERHYGALQGLNKAETAEKFGEAQVTATPSDYRKFDGYFLPARVVFDYHVPQGAPGFLEARVERVRFIGPWAGSRRS